MTASSTPPTLPPSTPAASASSSPKKQARKTTPSVPRRWLRRTAIASASALALLGALTLGAPPLIRWQGEKIASELLGRHVRIGAVQLRPWSLEFELRDVEMAAAEPGSAPQLSVARAYVNAGAASLWRLAPVLDAIEVEQPVVRLAHLGEGRLDIADILARFPADPDKPKEDDGKLFPFALYNIALTGGRFEFEDRATGSQHTISDMRLMLPFISTLAAERQVHVTPQLSFVLDGSRFDSQAHALPFDETRHTEAALRLAQLDLAPYLPYLPAGLPLQPTSGMADVDLRLRFEQSGATPALSVGGTLELTGVQAKDALGGDALAFERLHVAVADDTRPLQGHIHLAHVALVAPDVLVVRDKDGRLNFMPAEGAPATHQKAAKKQKEQLRQAKKQTSEKTWEETPPDDATQNTAAPASTADAAPSPAAPEHASAPVAAQTAPAAAPVKKAAAKATAKKTKKKGTAKKGATRKNTAKKKKKTAAVLMDDVLGALIPVAVAQNFPASGDVDDATASAQAAPAAEAPAPDPAPAPKAAESETVKTGVMPASGDVDLPVQEAAAPQKPAEPEKSAEPEKTTEKAPTVMPSSGDVDIDVGTAAAPQKTAAPAEPASTAASAASAAETAAAATPEAAEAAENTSELPDGHLDEHASADAEKPEKADKAPAAAKTQKTAAKDKTTQKADGAADVPVHILIDSITLERGRVELHDAAPTASGAPAAAVQVGEITLAAQSFAWPLDTPVSFEGSLSLAAAAGSTPAPRRAPAVVKRSATAAAATPVASATPEAASSATAAASAPEAAAQEGGASETAVPEAAASAAESQAVPTPLPAPAANKTSLKKPVKQSVKKRAVKKGTAKKKRKTAAVWMDAVMDDVMGALIPAALAQGAPAAGDVDTPAAAAAAPAADATEAAAPAQQRQAPSVMPAGGDVDDVPGMAPAAAASVQTPAAQSAKSQADKPQELPATEEMEATKGAMESGAASAASATSAASAASASASAAADDEDDEDEEAPLPEEPRSAAAPAARAKKSALTAPGAAWAAAKGAQTLRFHGLASMASAKVEAELANFAFALVRPYIALYLNGELDASASVSVKLRWEGGEKLHAEVPSLTLDKVNLTGAGIAAPAASGGAAQAAASTKSSKGKKGRKGKSAATAQAPAPEPQAAPAPQQPRAFASSASANDAASPADRARRGPLAAIEQIAVKDVQLDLAAHRVRVASLTVRGPRTTVLRAADGSLMVQEWLRSPPAAAAAPKAEKRAQGKQSKPATQSGKKTGKQAASSAPAAAASSSGGAPWSASLGEAAITGGAIAWRDAVPARPVRADVSDVALRVKNITWNGKALTGAIPVDFSTKLSVAERRSDPGRIAWSGQVAIEPLAVRGNLTAERLPVHAFMPYADTGLNIDVLRADASFKGRVQLAQQKDGLHLGVQGDARVQELRTHNLPDSEKRASAKAAAAARAMPHAPLAPDAAAERRASGLGEELLSLKSLRVDGIKVDMQPRRPLRIATGQTTLSDFYARLVILPDGTFSLRDIVAGDESGEAAAPKPAASATAAAAPDPNAPVISVGPVRIEGGRVAFTDRFIRPNYSADLSELRGALGAFSTAPAGGSVQMAPLQLTGRAQGTALLDISGSLNPLAKPLALEIKARATDLELPPLSPYSVKYAGHGIERGKLSVDVNYTVRPDGQLNATNRIVLNQLEFSEPVEGAPNSLPVKLATALLADSNGVIDLNLPISGSLNDPEFSLGPIIGKAIGGIIASAVTAPFRAIAGIFSGSGSAGDPSHVIFTAGSSQLNEAARSQLDGIAKALTERAQLKLTITGAAQLESEREGWQRQRLRDMLVAEMRGGDSNSAAAPSAAASDAEQAEADTPSNANRAAETEAALSKLDAEGYARLVRRLYRRADLPGKPRNAIGVARNLPVEEMERLLMAQIEVDDNAMRELALARGVAVKDYLTAKGLDGARIFLGSPRTAAPKAAAASAAGAVQSGGEAGDAMLAAPAAPASAASSAPGTPAGQFAGATLSLATK